MRGKVIAAGAAGLLAGFVLASTTAWHQQARAGREGQTETKEVAKGSAGQLEYKVGWVEVGAKGAILRERGQARGEGTKVSELGAAHWEYAGPLSGDGREWRDSPVLFKRPK